MIEISGKRPKKKNRRTRHSTRLYHELQNNIKNISIHHNIRIQNTVKTKNKNIYGTCQHISRKKGIENQNLGIYRC